ncbi:MAG TPA: toll/interleukin-1 receptor domain-containing protein, partial [Anaerolineales bacterium]
MVGERRRQLKVFLCHASGDKPPVRNLYKRLVAEGVDAWLDQEKLLPGQDWRVEIPRAVRDADVVVICLSNKSITKEGYIQKEIKFALDIASEKPEGTIFLIPARLEECVVPEQLGRWQWVDLFEENGFIRLLRSLTLRANRVGATIEPSGYESEDQETERRLDQLYTEGLAAFYTEDWDRAYQRFQSILRERPNHTNAAEKLAQAQRQRDLTKLYAQAAEAYESENWPAAIQALEELLGKSGDYKDAAQLLKDAKKRRQLRELYAEAKRLHAAQKWQAVIRVFDQIAGIDPAYPDPEGLLSSAQQEVVELKRLADLNDLYRQGIHKMEAGQWYEARDLLEQVHKAHIGFLETER